jgi:UDP-N-acetyl-2-amino-2-deoxyglucuronate dehydrogenase
VEPGKLRVAVIGSGMAFAPHARSLQDLADRIDLVCVAGRNRQALEQLRSDYPFIPCTTTALEDVWSDPGIEAVLILTPPNTHLELVGAAARHGKHVLLEKPLDVSTDRARAVVDVCARHRVRLGVVFQHRFRAGSIALRQLLDSGQLGQLAAVNVSIPWWRPQSYYDVQGRGSFARDGGGVLITQAIHTIDLMLDLAGPASEVHAYATTSPLHRMETEDLVGAALQFANGAIGTLSATTAAYPGFPERIELICRHATARLEGGRLEVYFHDGRRLEQGDAEGGGADAMAFAHGPHRALIGAFAQAIRDRRDPQPNGRQALEVHLFIDALLRSARICSAVQL